MTLLINNDEVHQVLTMSMTMDALEEAYRQQALGDAVCRPRIDIRIPTGEGAKMYQWGTMEGAYQFETDDGDAFEVKIGRFYLAKNKTQA